MAKLDKLSQSHVSYGTSPTWIKLPSGWSCDRMELNSALDDFLMERYHKGRIGWEEQEALSQASFRLNPRWAWPRQIFLLSSHSSPSWMQNLGRLLHMITLRPKRLVICLSWPKSCCTKRSGARSVVVMFFVLYPDISWNWVVSARKPSPKRSVTSDGLHCPPNCKRRISVWLPD